MKFPERKDTFDLTLTVFYVKNKSFFSFLKRLQKIASEYGISNIFTYQDEYINVSDGRLRRVMLVKTS